MTDRLTGMLKSGNHSLIIAHGDDTRVYDTKGIATLLQLVTSGNQTMQRATIADKVVGKAAAALMIIGGATAVHALLISDGAVELLHDAGVTVDYDKRVDHILNRTASGWCPMEQACRNCRTAEECLTAIKKTTEKLANKKTMQ